MAISRATSCAIFLVAFVLGSACQEDGNQSHAATPPDAPSKAAAPAASPPAAAAAPVASAPPPATPRLGLPAAPGMDFSSLSEPARRELGAVLSDAFCYCGCPHTVGACLKEHGNCRHARRMASLAASEASQGSHSMDIVMMLSRYYQSFSKPRANLKPDDRMCHGPKNARVTVAEFADFECPFCAKVRPMMADLAKKRQEVRVCYLPFPLSGHPNAIPAATAALYARDAGKFWPMHDLMFENQSSLGPESLLKLAARVGLDAAGLKKAIETNKYAAEIEASRASGRAAGIEGTPAVFVNGRKLVLPITPAALLHASDDELEWSNNKGNWAAD